MALKKIIILLLCSVVTLFSDGKVSAQTSSLSFANIHPRIINGTTVSRRSIPVPEIIIQQSNGEFLCSGTMIAPNIVLTASHCVTARASDHTVVLYGKNYAVSKVINTVARTQPNGDILYDIALLVLKTNPRSKYFPIITSRKTVAGDSLYIYGYGVNDTGNTDVLEMGSMVVSSTSSQWVNADYIGNGDSNTCEGDSGGPAFGKYTTKSGQIAYGLVATTAGGELANCGVGDHSYFINLQSSVVLSFLKRNVPGLVRQ